MNITKLKENHFFPLFLHYLPFKSLNDSFSLKFAMSQHYFCFDLPIWVIYEIQIKASIKIVVLHVYK
jgi:hypothetical protein